MQLSFSVFDFSLKTLKQRLEDSSEITIKLDLDTSANKNPPAVKHQTQPSLPESSKPSDSGSSAKQAATAESTVSESAAAGLSPASTSDIVMREEAKDCTTDSNVVSKANESVKGEDGSVPVATAKETVADLPKIDDNSFNILTAAVRQHRLTRETTTQSSEDEVTFT